MQDQTHYAFHTAARFRNEAKVRHFTFEQWEPRATADVSGIEYEV